MKIISLKQRQRLRSFDKLFHVEGAIKSIIAISAYVDIESIVQLIEFLSNSADRTGRPSLKIFIDKSSSRFFSDRNTRRELLEQQSIIEKEFSEGSGIFLVRFGKLFHSKVYLIEGNQKGKILLGSMNLTQKGISENEEILLVDNYEIDGQAVSNRLSSWVKGYSEILESESSRVVDDNNDNFPSCIRQFLLNGKIYYELKEQTPFRFKLSLPEGIINEQTNIHPLLDSNIADTISVEKLISDRNGMGVQLPSLGSTRAYWKKYCVKTCYGYWNPDLLNKELTNTLEKRIQQRKPYYDKVVSIIKEKEKDIKLSFIKLCEEIQSYLSEERNVIDWRYGDLERAGDEWDKWRETLLRKIENEEFYYRLVSGIASVPTPDIWNDPLSSKEFEDSFFESIIYHWSKEYSRETTNIIAQAMAWNLFRAKRKNNIDAETLKEAIDSWLSEHQENSIVDFNEEE
jgi:hypothetical protein